MPLGVTVDKSRHGLFQKGGGMKITIVYDNEVSKPGLRPDWGFSCLVEVFGKNVLFDTGANGSILLHNMKKLEIDPREIEEIVISHYHSDHTGGLSDLLDINPVAVYVPSAHRGMAGEGFIVVNQPTEIRGDIFLTGELKGIEQSLYVKTQRGLVVIAGCSHPGVRTILEGASQFGKPLALIGGLHGFRDFNVIEDLELICPAHCTQFKSEISSLYPEKYIKAGVGTVIEI